MLLGLIEDGEIAENIIYRIFWNYKASKIRSALHYLEKEAYVMRVDQGGAFYMPNEGVHA